MEDEEQYEYRADVAALAAPRTLDSGTVVFEVTLATVGDVLVYPWGEETATAEGLNDGVDDLVGQPVLIEDHPPINQGHVVNGDTGGRKLVGTIVGARFDATSGQRIAQLAVHNPVDQRRAKELGSVSEAYRARTVDGEQVSRIPNSVVIAKHGRAGSARLRADTQEGLLDPEALAKLMVVLTALQSAVEALTAKMSASEGDNADALKVAEAETVAAKADADAAMEAAASEHADATAAAKTAADEKLAESEASIGERADTLAGEMVALRRKADTLKVEIPDTAKTAAEIRAALAKGLGAPDETAARADTADAWIAAREAGPRADTVLTEAERLAQSGNTGDNANNTATVYPC